MQSSKPNFSNSRHSGSKRRFGKFSDKPGQKPRFSRFSKSESGGERPFGKFTKSDSKPAFKRSHFSKSKDESFSSEKPFPKRRFSDKSAHGNSFSERSNSDRSSSTRFGSDRKGFGDKSQFNSERRSFGDKSQFNSERKSFGDKSQFNSERRSFGDKSQFNSERKSFGDKSQFNSERKSFGDRPPFKKSFRSGKSFSGRPFSGRSSFRSNPRIQGTSIKIDQLINKVQLSEKVEAEIITINNQFADFDLDPRLKQNIAVKGYKIPTPIQDQSIPVGLQGLDVIGVANTGTGKTAAFLIPLINKVLANRSERVLIMAPTRELACQISDEFLAFSKGLGLYSAICIGGVDMGRQIKALRQFVNFVIGTPGRIKDLQKRRVLKLESFKSVVLDEVDLMVDMGFIHDVRTILECLPQPRHSLFYTATLEPKIKELVERFMKDPIHISVKKRETASSIEQDIVYVSNEKNGKMEVLAEHLGRPEFEKVLVFGRTKHGVDKIAKFLYHRGIQNEIIHGNKSQNYRQKALKRFKDGHVRVLIATDVAARGLDIYQVSHVINFDLPQTYEDYVHRIGRTGRADKRGKALTFVPR